MPVRRLRELSEAEASCWREPGPALWRQIAALWRMSARLAPRRFPAGVYKHRTIESANRQSERWERESSAG